MWARPGMGLNPCIVHSSRLASARPSGAVDRTQAPTRESRSTIQTTSRGSNSTRSRRDEAHRSRRDVPDPDPVGGDHQRKGARTGAVGIDVTGLAVDALEHAAVRVGHPDRVAVGVETQVGRVAAEGEALYDV